MYPKTLRRLAFGGWTTKPVPDLPENSLSSEEIDSNFLALQEEINSKENSISTLPVAKGGLGRTSLTQDYILTGNGSSPVGLKSPSALRSLISAEPAFTKNSAFNKSFGQTAGTVCQGNDPRLASSLQGHDLAYHSDVDGWSNSSPLMNGSPAQGTSKRVSRQDHRHPSDDTKANVSHTLASHSDVTGWGTITPLVNGIATPGTSQRPSREDHIHPTDTSRAPIGRALPAGGTTNQILRKLSNSDYNVGWYTIPGVGEFGKVVRHSSVNFTAISWQTVSGSYQISPISTFYTAQSGSNIIIAIINFSGGPYTATGQLCACTFAIARRINNVTTYVSPQEMSVAFLGGTGGVGILSPVSISARTSLASGDIAIAVKVDSASTYAQIKGYANITLLELLP